MTSTTPSTAAFSGLERALIRRRFQSLDPPLRIELAALSALVGAFLFWQARVPLDGLRHRSGAPAAAAALLAALALFSILGGILAGTRHATRLARGGAEPPWLALPIPPRDLARHLAWASGAPALLLTVPAAALLAAAAGLVPAWWIGVLAAAFVWMLLESARLGCAIALRAVALGAEPRPGLAPIERVRVSVRRSRAAGRVPAALWRCDPAWAALARKDVVVSLRPSPARPRAIVPVVLAVLSLAAWWLPVEPRLRHYVAFVLAILTSATCAEWLIALTGTDPFSVLRSLPIGVGAVWGARAGAALAAAVALVAAHAAAAGDLDPAARSVFLVWLGGAALAIGLLGVHYGVTLYPRADHAQRVLALTLSLAMAASIMIPLLGWLLLLTAVLHSARRIRGWERIEAR